MIPPSANARIASHSTKVVRLTVFVGYALFREAQWDAGSQYEAHHSVGVGTPAPLYFLGFQDAATMPWFQQEPGPYVYLHGLSTQPYPLQPSMYSSHTLPGGYGGLALGAGGHINPSFTVGYEDPGSFPRCDTNPGGPIHLTTNISVVSCQVSPLYVCRYSIWKVYWY